MDSAAQFDRILGALPQTQCTRCGYPDCEAYAHAIAHGEADINRCPPGGQGGVELLANITQRATKPLDPECGTEAPRSVFFIDEAWCIGCTLCITACPTDAIIGSNKRMHTVIEAYCTGCALCLPVCPVDCILQENASGTHTGWAAWTSEQAQTARTRYAAKRDRTQREQQQAAHARDALAEHKLQDLSAHSRIEDPAVLDKKKAIIEAAMERARAKRMG